MGCDNITAFVGETRDGQGGSVRLDAIGANKDQAIISVTTEWDHTDNYETIKLNRSLSFTEDTLKYTVTFKSVGYSSYKNEYFCKFEVCRTTVTPPATPTPTPPATPTPTPIPEQTVNITINHKSHGKVELYAVLYWQDSMSGWANIPSTIPDKPTQFAVYWKSNVAGTVCGYVNFKINSLIEAPLEGNGQCVTSTNITKIVRYGIDKLPADTVIEIDICDSSQCPPMWVVCRKGCIPGTFTKLTGRLIDGVCEQIPNSPDCGYVADVGSIRCQAYDSVSNAALNTTIQINGLTIVPKTPHTITDLTPTEHRITFILEGYATKDVTVTVKAGQTVEAYGSMVKEAAPDMPGFDIKVNIPGLLPRSSLHVQQVVKVPFTDTWWSSPLGHGMRWNNISNSTYKARARSADSSPTPSFHTGFSENEDYAIYAGTSAIAFYPGSIVKRSSGSVQTIDLTSSYVDWVSSNLCAAMDITPANCPYFIASTVSDAAFLLELWTIITKHENLAGEPTSPTALDFALIPVAILGMLSPGISEGKIVEVVGNRITTLIKISKKGTDEVKAVLKDTSLDAFVIRASPDQFLELTKYLENGLTINAKNLLKSLDDVPLTANEIHGLQRASNFVKALDTRLVKAGSLTPIKTILRNFSTKFKNVFKNALDFARDNPKTSIGIGVLALWFMVDNIPFYIYMYLKSKGRSPGDRSWQAKLYVDKIDQYKFNIINAEKIQDWDLFCTNLKLMEDSVDTLETYILANKSTLVNEETFEIYKGTVEVYREAIKLKNEVHTCVKALPEVINAEVIEILDSDTVKIRYNGSEYTVRLLGINAPEGKTYDYTCTGVRSPFLIRRLITPGKECIGEETWTGTEELYNASKVWIGQNLPVHHNALFYSDPARQFDKYGRLLALPRYSNKNICVESLKAGMSVVFFYDTNKQVSTYEFLQAEKVAKDAKIGVWATEAGTGTIRCVSTPTAAEVWLDGEYTGKKTISSVALLENVSVGSHKVEFRKIIDNVTRKCSKTVTVVKDTTVNMSCTLTGDVTPTPPPSPTGQLHCKTTKPNGTSLSGAKIYLTGYGYNNQYMGDTEKTLTIPVDTYSKVKYTYPGYEDCIISNVVVRENRLSDATCQMKVQEDTFPITIVSNPTGAIISVDGKQV